MLYSVRVVQQREHDGLKRQEDNRSLVGERRIVPLSLECSAHGRHHRCWSLAGYRCSSAVCTIQAGRCGSSQNGCELSALGPASPKPRRQSAQPIYAAAAMMAAMASEHCSKHQVGNDNNAASCRGRHQPTITTTRLIARPLMADSRR